ncbi:hypothetical protein HPB50_003126 [Hyalomma asiaticum]|uniref:Uncharacterized protein n=1 Tax=Hyalomma asiaticum TaxID=266040 RepID=A0ACB7RTT5_HYAAI|nr:hypothetical protein HPB50_003126 [Hyalomma asiaticum]
MHSLELYENEPKQALYFPEPEQILAMQKLAAMCVFVVVVATALFAGYFILWLHKGTTLTPHAPPPPGHPTTDNNDPFTVFPLTFSTEALVAPDSEE